MQTRVMSLVESAANIVVGYGVAVITQLLVFPLFGLAASLADNLAIGLIFTIVSLARSYALRRFFNARFYTADVPPVQRVRVGPIQALSSGEAKRNNRS